MLREQLLERLEAIFFEELTVAVPARDTDLIAEGYLDSLLLVNLLLVLEVEFSIAIQLEQLEFEKFETINKIADFVETELAESAAGYGHGGGQGPQKDTIEERDDWNRALDSSVLSEDLGT